MPSDIELPDEVDFAADPRDAVGAWNADDVRGYEEWSLIQALEHFEALYGRGALVEHLSSNGYRING